MSAELGSPVPTVTFRAMEVTDIPLVVRIHRRYLHGGFFVDLGSWFLGHYYRTFLTSPVAVTLMEERGGVCVGFLVGTVDEAAHRRHVIRTARRRLVRVAALSLLVRPALTVRFSALARVAMLAAWASGERRLLAPAPQSGSVCSTMWRLRPLPSEPA